MTLLKRHLVLFSFFATFATFGVGQGSFGHFRDEEYRQNRAKQWREEFTKLNAQIPTLSPAEERWLNTEIDDTIAEAEGKYTSRALEAMDSREYQIRVTKPHVQALIRILDRIVSSSYRNESQEALLWAQLVALFISQEFWQSIDHLVRLNIFEEKTGILDGRYHENHVLWGQQILYDVVITYLSSNSLP